VKKVVHPLITTFVLTDLCAALLGFCSGVSPEVALTSFLTRGKRITPTSYEFTPTGNGFTPDC
jgi:hypothetical protein